MKELRNKLSEIDSPVSPDVSATVLEVFVRVVVVLELLHEVSVCLNEEVSVTATNLKQSRLLAEVCLKLLAEVLVDR